MSETIRSDVGENGDTARPASVATPDGSSPSRTLGGVGICCSGGGIRAASFALGCLQVLDEKKVLRGPSHARYISAVSGGSYAVGGAAIVEYGLERGPDAQPAHFWSRGQVASNRGRRGSDATAIPRASAGDAPVEPGPFAQGSPELDYLRKHLGYLKHGPGGLSAEVWRAFMGIVMNLVLFVSLAALGGYATGWIYGWRVREVRGNCAAASACVTAVSPPSWVVVVMVVLGSVALVSGLLWVMRRWQPAEDQVWRHVAMWSLVAAVLWALLLLGMPQVLAWLVRSSLPDRAHAAKTVSAGIRSSWLPFGGLAGVLVAVRAAISEFKSLNDPKSTNPLAGLFRKFRAPLTNLLCAIAVPVLFGSLIVLFTYEGARNSVFVGGTSGWNVLGVAAPAAVLLFVTYFGDLNSWSLHTIYKFRLGDAFGLERTDPPPGSRHDRRQIARPRREPLPLSNLQLAHFPEVLICATSNITSYGDAPSGLDAGPFLFSPTRVGGPVVGVADTQEYELEGLRMPRNLTVMDAVSISGAAVSPEMGKMTRAPMRFLLTLANVRLGVWLPKPNKVFPNGPTPRSVPSAADSRRFLDVGMVRPSSRNGKQIPPPAVRHLLNEAFGHTAATSSYVYVTDGGHYDNLGLVELLRPERQCEWIWCVDASGDSISTFTTLGEALALAQAELGVTVDITPDEDMKVVDDVFVKQPYCVGTITYPPDETGRQRTGTLVVVKAGVPEAAPWSVRSYQAKEPNFPCDSTLDQLYTAERFDAYLALGHYAMSEAYKATLGQYATALGVAADALVP